MTNASRVGAALAAKVLMLSACGSGGDDDPGDVIDDSIVPPPLRNATEVTVPGGELVFGSTATELLFTPQS